MSTSKVKPVNEAPVEEGYEGLEALEGEQDLFVSSQTETFPVVMWANGLPQVKSLTDKRPVGISVGWHIEAGKFGADLDGALDNLIGLWQEEQETARQEKREADSELFCEKVFLQHRGQGGKPGNIVEYYALPVVEFFPLAHGIPSQYATTHNDGLDGKPSGRLGVARFWQDKKTNEGNWTVGGGHTKVLGIIKRLYLAGYQKEDGTPLPVMLTTSGMTGVRFASVLERHADVVKYVREVEKKTTAPYYAFSITTYPSYDTETVVSKATGESSEIYPVLSTIPAKDAIDGTYTRAHFCGGRLLLTIKKMVDDIAIPWCNRQVNYGIYTQVMAKRFRGVVPASAKKLIEELSSTVMDENTPSRGGDTAEKQAEELQYADQEMVQNLVTAVEKFIEIERTDLAEDISAVLAEFEGQEDQIPYDVAESLLRPARAQYAKAKKEYDAQKGAKPTVASKFGKK